MTNTEILERAIEKAIEGGFVGNYLTPDIKNVEDVYYYFSDGHGELDVNKLIWRHDFAKALWCDAKVPDADEQHDNQATLGMYSAEGGGYEGYGDYVTLHFNGDAWHYHLQQMVIAEDPIKYLGEHLPN